jgi:histone deacetylase complex regulatory component SIN3
MKGAGLRPTPHISVEEKLIIHIQVLRGWTNRDIAQRFQHSGQTISKIVCEVVTVMRSVNHLFMVAPTADTPLDPGLLTEFMLFFPSHQKFTHDEQPNNPCTKNPTAIIPPYLPQYNASSNQEESSKI